MRNGKKRKEIYLSRDEVSMIKDAQSTCGLDVTNTMRLLIRLGYINLTGAPYIVGNSIVKNEKPEFKRQLNGN